MADIGHNILSDRELLERNLRTGMRSAGFDVLVCAAADKRLDRKAILVLAGIVWAMQHTGYATPSRAALASFAGVSLKRISNIIYDLTSLGYIARINVEEEEKKVYTYGEQLNHDQIEAEISRYCAELRGRKVPDIEGIFNEAAATLGEDRGEKFPEKVPGKSEKFPELDQKFPEIPKSSRKKFPEVDESSRYAGNSQEDQCADSDPTLYRRDNTIPNGIVCADGADFFGGVPKVIVRDRTHYANGDKITFKPAGEKRQTEVTLNFLRGIAGPQHSDEDLLDYAAWVAHALYNGALPNRLKNGEARTVFNHITGSFKIWDEKQTFTAFEQWRRGRVAQNAKAAADTSGVLPLTPFNWDEE